MRDEVGEKPYLGLHFKSGSLKTSAVLKDSPAELAGIQPGDEILALQGLRVSSENWSGLFEQVAEIERSTEVLLSRRGRIMTLPVSPSRQPVGTLSIEIDDRSTPLQEKLRQGWLWEDRPGKNQ